MRGQWDKRAAFAAQTFAGTVFVTTDGALVYSLPGTPMADATPTDGVALPNHPNSKHAASPDKRGPGWALSERFVDGNQKVLPAQARGYRPQTAQVSYFIGPDETKHQRGVAPTSASISAISTPASTCKYAPPATISK